MYSKFKSRIGDVVQLVGQGTNSPKMTVIAKWRETCDCAWFVGTQFNRCTLPYEALWLVNENS